MGIINFFKEAGEKLFGHKETEAAAAAVQAAPDDGAAQARLAEANQKAASAITAYVASQGLNTDGLNVAFDGTTCEVTVSGNCPDQATKEKVVLCCGNVTGVKGVNDLLTVSEPADESRWYTVVKGDTLSAISKAHYGTPNQYMKIFEANKPMLKDPDRIYPGQLLRIPA